LWIEVCGVVSAADPLLVVKFTLISGIAVKRPLMIAKEWGRQQHLVSLEGKLGCDFTSYFNI
jgi:hypothetical protein